MLEGGIITIFDFVVRLFGLMYTSAFFIFEWFTTPLADTIGTDLPSDLEIFLLSPFELMFGVGLISVLVVAVIKFFTNVL